MGRIDKISSLLDFIKTHFLEYVFDRGLTIKDGAVLGFTTYQEFLTFQEQKLKSATNGELAQWETLMDLLPKSRIMDEEDMCAIDSEGFCFDRKGRLVITMGR